MEGEQIPKATMTNFLKAKLKISFSAEFGNKALALAKDYINRLTQQANDVCTKHDKKTINAQHIQSALINFGLEYQLKQLKEISSQIKEQNQMKQQFRQRIQQNIQKNLQEISGQQNEPRVISIKENIGQIQIIDQIGSQDIDYEAQMQDQGSQKPQKQPQNKPKTRNLRSNKKNGQQEVQQIDSQN